MVVELWSCRLCCTLWHAQTTSFAICDTLACTLTTVVDTHTTSDQSVDCRITPGQLYLVRPEASLLIGRVARICGAAPLGSTKLRGRRLTHAKFSGPAAIHISNNSFLQPFHTHHRSRKVSDCSRLKLLWQRRVQQAQRGGSKNNRKKVETTSQENTRLLLTAAGWQVKFIRTLKETTALHIKLINTKVIFSEA